MPNCIASRSWIFARPALAAAAMVCAASAASETETAPKTPAPIPPGHVLLSEEGSERATVGAGNMIVTVNGKTHVVWQAADKTGYKSMFRTLDRATGKWSEPVTLNRAKDNHARPYITVDGDGFLHVVTAGHNTPFAYVKSVRPNDGTAWTKPVTFGAGTYPYLLAGPDGSLLLAARPDKHAGVDLYMMKRGEPWQKIRPLILKREPQYREYAGYNSVLQWGPGRKRLHFACDVYEGFGTYKQRGENQLVVHMYTEDLGATWHRADGTLIEGEPYPKNMDVLAGESRKRKDQMPEPAVRLGGMVVDATGRPFVLLTNDDEPERGKASLLTPDESAPGKWRELGLQAALRRHDPESGALGPAGGFTLTSAGVLQMVIPVAPFKSWGLPEKKGIDPGAISYLWVETADAGKSFAIRPALPSGDGAQRNAPTLEKPTGFNRVADGVGTGMVYFEGLRRYRKENELIQTRVFFAELK
jgi:hypothetical protein